MPWPVGRSAAGTDTNRRNAAPPTNCGLLMDLYALLWLSLVLGGVAGCLWLWEALRETWLRLGRVPAGAPPRMAA